MTEKLAEKLPEKSVLRPWLDVTEEAKFFKGQVGVTADRWLEKPNLSPCCKGGEENREWHIEDGRHYGEQLYCRYWKRFVNASGANCEWCRARTWPETERLRAHTLPMLKDKKTQADAILAAAKSGRLTKTEAIQLGEELGL